MVRKTKQSIFVNITLGRLARARKQKENNMIVIFNTMEKNSIGECKYCLKIKDEIVFTFWHNPRHELPLLLLKAISAHERTNNKKHINLLLKETGHRAETQVKP